jgi:hypothetical protein
LGIIATLNKNLVLRVVYTEICCNKESADDLWNTLLAVLFVVTKKA